VHVAWVAKGCSTGGHDGGDELVRLLKGRVHNVQPVGSDFG
jgi:hypothetical protein